jgi:mono/diheme cytochrome c family protein
MRIRELVVIAALLAACGGPAQRGEPAGPPVITTTAQQARGHALFDRLCYKCHPGGEQGLGVGLNDKKLPGPAIRAQVRTGAGAMPKFSKDDLSDRDLDAVVDYVRALRNTPPNYAGR